MSSYCKGVGKGSWPELVGTMGELASAVIKNESPHVHAVIVAKGSFVTMDFRCDRVRVWVDQSGVVVEEPRLG